LAEAGAGRSGHAAASRRKDKRQWPLGAAVAGAHEDGGRRGCRARVAGPVVEPLERPEWHDFGPAFASQRLAGRHDIEVSKETVRGWTVAARLWKAQPRKPGEEHFWRPRRSAYGELVQWGAPHHDWAEGRGEAVRYLVK
jgi:hypothetical protein